jgi:antitoxin component YwqK of YwqJK toxin-antitoxin module
MTEHKPIQKKEKSFYENDKLRYEGEFQNNEFHDNEKNFDINGILKLSKEEHLEYLKEQEIDRISNGECPTISYDLWFSRLTSEQREVEKEKQIQFGIWFEERRIRLEKEAKQDEEDEVRALKYEKMQEAFAVLIAYEDRKKEKESG